MKAKRRKLTRRRPPKNIERFFTCIKIRIETYLAEADLARKIDVWYESRGVEHQLVIKVGRKVSIIDLVRVMTEELDNIDVAAAIEHVAMQDDLVEAYGVDVDY